jgi:hypothetical protein
MRDEPSGLSSGRETAGPKMGEIALQLFPDQRMTVNPGDRGFQRGELIIIAELFPELREFRSCEKLHISESLSLVKRCVSIMAGFLIMSYLV